MWDRIFNEYYNIIKSQWRQIDDNHAYYNIIIVMECDNYYWRYLDLKSRASCSSPRWCRASIMADQDGGGLIIFSQIFNISRKQFCVLPVFSTALTDSKQCAFISSNIPMFSHLKETLSSSLKRVLSSGLSKIQLQYNYSHI